MGERVRRILIADDVESNLIVLEDLLEDLGDFRVLRANSGQEAVDLVSREQPELVLMDIRMPDMDGVAAISLLREHGYSGPVVAQTASKSLTRKKELEEIFDEVLFKPLEIEHLRRLLDELLQEVN